MHRYIIKVLEKIVLMEDTIKNRERDFIKRCKELTVSEHQQYVFQIEIDRKNLSDYVTEIIEKNKDSYNQQFDYLAQFLEIIYK